jgi:putative DNA primase/helicase
MNAAAIPAELAERAQWVCYRVEQRDGKQTKVPYRPGRVSARASSTDPEAQIAISDSVYRNLR